MRDLPINYVTARILYLKPFQVFRSFIRLKYGVAYCVINAMLGRANDFNLFVSVVIRHCNFLQFNWIYIIVMKSIVQLRQVGKAG